MICFELVICASNSTQLFKGFRVGPVLCNASPTTASVMIPSRIIPYLQCKRSLITPLVFMLLQRMLHSQFWRSFILNMRACCTSLVVFSWDKIVVPILPKCLAFTCIMESQLLLQIYWNLIKHHLPFKSVGTAPPWISLLPQSSTLFENCRKFSEPIKLLVFTREKSQILSHSDAIWGFLSFE